MANLGVGEIVVLLLLAMLVFGPNRLPEIARNVGKAMRAFQQESRRAADVFRTAIDDGAPEAGVIDRPDEPGRVRGDRAEDGAAAATPAAPARAAPAIPPGATPAAPAAAAIPPAGGAPVDPHVRRYEDT